MFPKTLKFGQAFLHVSLQFGALNHTTKMTFRLIFLSTSRGPPVVYLCYTSLFFPLCPYGVSNAWHILHKCPPLAKSYDQSDSFRDMVIASIGRSPDDTSMLLPEMSRLFRDGVCPPKNRFMYLLSNWSHRA